MDDVECVHECPDGTNKGIRIGRPAVPQTWLPGAPDLPAIVWCWSHGQWEEVGEPTAVPTDPHNLTAGDVFERHGHTWTVEHVVRTWCSSVHVMCAGGGDVWIPAGEMVTVLGSSGS